MIFPLPSTLVYKGKITNPNRELISELVVAMFAMSQRPGTVQLNDNDGTNVHRIAHT